MRNIIFLFGFLVSFMNANAQAECLPARSLKAEQPNGIQDLIKILEGIPAPDFEQPLRFPLNEILAKVDPRLSDSDGSCAKNVYDYKLQILPVIDNEMIFSILDKLPRDNRLGLSILSPNFWLTVQKAQLAGLKLAWIVSAPKVVNGVYFSKEKIIAVSWHSDIATLFHELRHHLQAIQFDYRGEFQKMLVNRRAEYAYSSSCLANLNTYFGELDATIEDLAYWPDYFVNLNVEQVVKVKKEYSPIHLFTVNLSYPYQVSEKVLRDRTCPEAFKIATREIWDILKLSDLSVKAKSLQATLFVASRLDPKTSGERLSKLLVKAEELRNYLSEEIPKTLKLRRTGVQRVLKKLPRHEYQLWCGYDGAFKLLAGCEDEEAP